MRIKDYQARRSLETGGSVTVEKKGNVVADKILCGSLVARGADQGEHRKSGHGVDRPGGGDTRRHHRAADCGGGWRGVGGELSDWRRRTARFGQVIWIGLQTIIKQGGPHPSPPPGYRERGKDGLELAPHPTLERYYGARGKRDFVKQIFDQGAGDYDQIESLMALGTGGFYRRLALVRAGMLSGMRVLDVAVGTGLIARQAIDIVGQRGSVIGLDPSQGMLEQADIAGLSLVQGRAEDLPFESDRFDFLSMGYALRHVADLRATFAEFHRVLKPGGIACVLEITCPRTWLGQQCMKAYLTYLVPGIWRWRRRHEAEIAQDSAGPTGQLLWEYYWDTIRSCVQPAAVQQAMAAAGFEQVRRHTTWGIFSEYCGFKPASP